MMVGNRAIVSVLGSAIAGLVVALAAIVSINAATKGAEKPSGGNLMVCVFADPDLDENLAHRPVMVSVSREGEVVQQREVTLAIPAVRTDGQRRRLVNRELDLTTESFDAPVSHLSGVEDRFHSHWKNIPPGQYDIRVEGDGFQTVVKKGIQIVASGRYQTVIVDMRGGEGTRVIEYASGGLSRDEIATRLKKLEEAVADLQKKIAGPSAEKPTEKKEKEPAKQAEGEKK
jgi:hypothetical protein